MKTKLVKVGAWLLGLSATSLPLIAQADTPTFLPSDAGEEISLGTTNPIDITINIVNWSLGILGLVAVVFVLIGGFRWMTSGGNEQSVESAKKILIAALIGLLIVMASYGIASYIFSTLITATGAA